MIVLSTIIKTFEAEFLAQYSGKIRRCHRQALAAMKICRTRQSPKLLMGCDDCEHRCLIPHSCGHRLCPHCQAHESQQWLERQLQQSVPAEYFLITFTLPAEFRPLARLHQRPLYSAMIRCAWETLRTFSQNDKQLQGIPGAIAVLHTHSRRLDFHPHVHIVMPAAAIDPVQRLWRTKQSKNNVHGKIKNGYLFNHKALAQIFRVKMLEAITQAGLKLPKRYPLAWVVDCRSVGSGYKALGYLGRYLYRGVIQEKDIIACEQGQVTFRYRNARTQKTEYRTVTGAKFLWLVLQHTLPKGFRRARNFGFLHPNSQRLIQLLKVLLKLDPSRTMAWTRQRPTLTCRICGAPMKIIKTRIPPLFPSIPRTSTG